MSQKIFRTKSRVTPIKVGPLGISLKEQKDSKLKQAIRQFLSVRILFMLFVVVQNLLIASIGWTIMYSYGSLSIQDTTQKLADKVSLQIYQQIKSYMAVPPVVLKTTAHHFSPDSGSVDVRSFGVNDDKSLIWKHMWYQYSALEEGGFSQGFFLCTTWEDFAGFRPSVTEGETFVYSWRNLFKNESLHAYGVDTTTGMYGEANFFELLTTFAGLPKFPNATYTIPDFDLGTMYYPWIEAVQRKQPYWTDIYLFPIANSVLLTATYPFFDGMVSVLVCVCFCVYVCVFVFVSVCLCMSVHK